MATIVHTVRGAAGELAWPVGPPVQVRAHPSTGLHPCALRHAVVGALASGSCEWLSRRLGREGDPVARLLPGPTRSDLGGGVQRFVCGRHVLYVLATMLDADAAARACREATTLPALLRVGACRHAWSTGLAHGVARDELTRVSVVWLAHPGERDDLDEAAVEGAWAMAGACAAAEAVAAV